jgi:FHA domain
MGSLIAFAVAMFVFAWLAKLLPLRRSRLGRRAKIVWARLQAKRGPMSPQHLVRLALDEAKRAATPTVGGAFLPNDIRVGIHPSDWSAWEPLSEQLPQDVAEALRAAAGEDPDLRLLGQIRVDAAPDPLAAPYLPRFTMRLVRPDVARRDPAPAPTPRRISTPKALRPCEPVASGPASGPRPTRHEPFTYDGASTSSPHVTQRLCVVTIRTQGSPRRSLQLSEGRHLIGRTPGASVEIDDPSVSMRHAELVISRSGVTIRDLGSTNGTRVRWSLADEPRALFDDDEVWLSRSVCMHVANTGCPAL